MNINALVQRFACTYSALRDPRSKAVAGLLLARRGKRHRKWTYSTFAASTKNVNTGENDEAPTTSTAGPSRCRSDMTSNISTSILSLLTSTPEMSGTEETTTVNGWVRSLRRLKNVSFADIRDGSTFSPFQVVLTKDLAEGLSNGSAVQITGTWASGENQGGQGSELVAKSVKLLGVSDAKDYPLQKKSHGAPYLRTVPHLRCRAGLYTLLLRLRSRAIESSVRFFGDREFVQAHPPILTSSDCEGAGEVFQVSARKGGELFFGQSTYMTVSTQLHLEALVQSVPKVWSLSPTFRAEASDTMRHLSEFYMLEAEVAFLEKLEDLMGLAQDYIVRLTEDLAGSRLGEELLSYREKFEEEGSVTAESLSDRWKSLTTHGKWPRLTYTEAIGVLEGAIASKRAHFALPVSWGLPLQSEHERFVAEEIGKGYPVFVTDYPSSFKPFYMLPSTLRQGKCGSEDNSGDGHGTVACFDLLVPGAGELAGGSLREHRHDKLERNMSEKFSKGKKIEGVDAGGSPEDANERLAWYLELRKWGTVPHGGFGIGFDRLLLHLSGTENIKDVVAFPRWSGRCSC